MCRPKLSPSVTDEACAQPSAQHNISNVDKPGPCPSAARAVAHPSDSLVVNLVPSSASDGDLQCFKLDNHKTRITIGRSTKNDVGLTLHSISSMHSELFLVPGIDGEPATLRLKDTSSNGTGIRLAAPDSRLVRCMKDGEVLVGDGSLIVLPMRIKAALAQDGKSLRTCFQVIFGELPADGTQVKRPMVPELTPAGNPVRGTDQEPSVSSSCTRTCAPSASSCDAARPKVFSQESSKESPKSCAEPALEACRPKAAPRASEKGDDKAEKSCKVLDTVEQAEEESRAATELMSSLGAAKGFAPILGCHSTQRASDSKSFQTTACNSFSRQTTGTGSTTCSSFSRQTTGTVSAFSQFTQSTGSFDDHFVLDDRYSSSKARNAPDMSFEDVDEDVHRVIEFLSVFNGGEEPTEDKVQKIIKVNTAFKGDKLDVEAGSQTEGGLQEIAEFLTILKAGRLTENPAEADGQTIFAFLAAFSGQAPRGTCRG